MVWTLGSFLFFTVLVAVVVYAMVRKDPQSSLDDYFLGGPDGMGYCWLAHPHKSLYRAFDRAERRRLQSHRCRHGGNYHRTGPGTDSALFLPRYLNRGLTTIIMVQSIYLRLPSRFTWPGKATRSR
jgi:hypothetical protein